MKKLLITAVAAATFALGAIGAFAASNPSVTGQPSQTCLSSPSTMTEPGNAANNSGSPFNEGLPGMAGNRYAGSGFVTTPANGNASSQYDVACYQVSQPH